MRSVCLDLDAFHDTYAASGSCDDGRFFRSFGIGGGDYKSYLRFSNICTRSPDGSSLMRPSRYNAEVCMGRVKKEDKIRLLHNLTNAAGVGASVRHAQCFKCSAQTS
jgi:hypothetical protein